MADRDISDKTRQYIASGYKLPVDPASARGRGRRAYEAARFVLSVIAMALAIAFTFTLAPALFAAAAVMMVSLFVIDGIGFVAFTAAPWVKRFAEGRGRDDQDAAAADDIPVYTTDTITTLVGRWLRRRFSWRWMVSTALTATFVVCLLRNVGATVLPNNALAPLVRANELVVFSKRIEAAGLAHGDWIIFRFDADTVVGREGQPTIGRIIAGPGDELSINEGRFAVNGEDAGRVGVTQGQRAAVVVPETPVVLTVPGDCWFVICEQGGTLFDGRLLGWARRERIIGAELVVVSLERFGTRLDDDAGAM